HERVPGAGVQLDVLSPDGPHALRSHRQILQSSLEALELERRLTENLPAQFLETVRRLQLRPVASHALPGSLEDGAHGSLAQVGKLRQIGHLPDGQHTEGGKTYVFPVSLSIGRLDSHDSKIRQRHANGDKREDPATEYEGRNPKHQRRPAEDLTDKVDDIPPIVPEAVFD